MYQHAFLQNTSDFTGATVLDVGTGTGLLAFFAAQAGARKVYAVEHAGPMAELARLLVKGNSMEKVIEVMNCSVEKCGLKEKVDIIVSEPIGFLLVHERMLESFVQARDMYLRPGGLMMPSTSDIVVAPFTDETLWAEQNGLCVGCLLIYKVLFPRALESDTISVSAQERASFGQMHRSTA